MKALKLTKDLVDGQLWVWEAPNPSASYVIGVDPAQGRSRTQGDHTCISIWRRSASRIDQAAEWYGRVDPAEQATTIHQLCLRYRGHDDAAILNVERNIGDAILMGLRAQEFPEHCLFVPRATASKTQAQDEGRVFFHKHAANEQFLFDSFVAMADSESLGIKSKLLWEEIYSLREEPSRKTGTVRVPTGGKDRTVAMLMAMVAHLQSQYQDAPEVAVPQDDAPPQGVDIDAWREKRGMAPPSREDWGELDGAPDYEVGSGLS